MTHRNTARREPGDDDLAGRAEHRVAIVAGGIEGDRVGRRRERGVGPPRIPLVAGADFLLHGGRIGRDPPPGEFQRAAPGAASRLAVTNNFTVASGKITVPMSRPSSTAPRAAAKLR